MAKLILLNGPPASGKSTIAAELVSTRPLALNLDVDLVRGQLGQWQDRPTEAGLSARRLALAMAEAHLSIGHDVVVPQFLARADFIVALEDVARHTRSSFFEVALLLTRRESVDAFNMRSAAPENQQHRDAHRMVEILGGGTALEAMHDDFIQLLNTRPNAQRIRVRRGEVHATVDAVEAAIRV